MTRHSGGGFALKLFGVGCSFAFAVAVARLLGPAGFGTVAVAISTATVAATIALLGANGLAVRQIAASCARADWTSLRRFIAWSSLIVFAAASFSASLMAASSLVAGTYGPALLLGAMLVPLLAGLNLLRGVLQGSGRVLLAQLPVEVIRWVVILVLLALLFLGNSAPRPGTIMLMVLVGHVAALAVAGALLRDFLRTVPRGRAGAHPRDQWLTQSLPFLMVAVFGIVGTEISTLLLGWLSGPREAGLYQPIARLAPLILLANDAIETALAPRFARMWQTEDVVGIQRLARKSAIAATLATATVALAILLLSPFILRAFGAEFVPLAYLLVWIAAAQVINAATGAAPLLLTMIGDMKRRIHAQAATLIVQAGLGIALVPRFGAAGAVASLTVAILTWSVLHWWLARSTTGIDTSVLGLHRR